MTSGNFKTGLVSISFREESVETLIEAVRQAGLEGVEWGGDVHVPHGNLSRAEEVRRWTEEAGLQVSAYGSYYKFEDLAGGGGPEPSAVLDTAEALGASMIRLWPGAVGTVDASAEWRQVLADRTREIAEAAVLRGLELGFEFHDHSLTDTPESTLSLLQLIGHPAVSTFWQPYLQTSPEERMAGLEIVLDRVTNIHVNYFDQNPWPDNLPLQSGTAEWVEYLNLLKETGRDHWLTIEHVRGHRLDQFADDARVLKSWVETR